MLDHRGESLLRSPRSADKLGAMKKPWSTVAIVLFAAAILFGGLFGDQLLALSSETRSALKNYTEMRDRAVPGAGAFNGAGTFNLRVGGAGDARLAGEAAPARLEVAALADVPGQFRNVEITVAVEGDGGGGAVLELEKAAEMALGIEMGVRPPGDATDGFDQPAAGNLCAS